MDKKITNGWSSIKPVDQLPLSGVLVKDLRKLHNARNEARLARVKKIWGRTLPQIVHERNRYLGLRTYGKGAAKNQLVVRQIWTPICRKGPFKKKREQKNKHFEVCGSVSVDDVKSVRLDPFPIRMNVPMIYKAPIN
ncbi:hypothetical protein ACOSQ2_015519 [Xanthoceras sorbifolium]